VHILGSNSEPLWVENGHSAAGSDRLHHQSSKAVPVPLIKTFGIFARHCVFNRLRLPRDMTENTPNPRQFEASGRSDYPSYLKGAGFPEHMTGTVAESFASMGGSAPIGPPKVRFGSNPAEGLEPNEREVPGPTGSRAAISISADDGRRSVLGVFPTHVCGWNRCWRPRTGPSRVRFHLSPARHAAAKQISQAARSCTEGRQGFTERWQMSLHARPLACLLAAHRCRHCGVIVSWRFSLG